MTVTEPDFACRRAIGAVSGIIIRGPHTGRAAGGGIGFPAYRAAGFCNRRHVIVVEHRLKHGQQFIWRFPRYLKLLLSAISSGAVFIVADPNVAKTYAKRFIRQSGQAFDVIVVRPSG